jgi:hypothetical protein
VTDDHRIRGWEMLHHPFADEERFINLGLAGNRGSSSSTCPRPTSGSISARPSTTELSRRPQLGKTAEQ